METSVSSPRHTVRGGVGNDPAALDVGEATLSREVMNSTTVAIAASTLRLTFFTARKAETSTQVRVCTGGTAAAATPTLCRLGLYQVESGTGTLVASTANDTTLFAAITTPYTRAWTTPVQKVAGARYALGIVVVTGAALPTFAGQSVANGPEALIAPALSGSLGSQTDLPATFSVGALSATGNRIYGAILP